MNQQALKILKQYHQELVERLAEEISENEDAFGAFSFGPADEIMDKYAHKLNCLVSVMKNVEHQVSGKKVRHRYRVKRILDEGEGFEEAINKWLDENPQIAVQSMSMEDSAEPPSCLLLYVSRDPNPPVTSKKKTS
ncbi:MAG: hypothetical protein P1V97_15620 [Planctomycetota bacterium]|nr:hypothetical protein [Planctomycetota bacterium]